MRQAQASSFRRYTLVADNGIAAKSQSVALILSNYGFAFFYFSSKPIIFLQEY